MNEPKKPWTKPHKGLLPYKGDFKAGMTRRRRATAEADLRWFFGEARGVLGLRGQSYEPGQRGEDSVAAAERRTDAYVRWVGVQAGLENIGADDRRVLSLAFVDRSWPAEIADWYEKAGVGAWLLSRIEQACHGRAVAVDVATGMLVAMAKDQTQVAEVSLLRAKAERRLREALERYCEAYLWPRRTDGE